MFRTITLAALVAAFAPFTTTALAEESDDGWDCSVEPGFVNGSYKLGYTVICDNMVWLCPPAEDGHDYQQSECHEAVPSKLAVAPAPVATAQPSPPPEDSVAPEPRVEIRGGLPTITNTPAAPQSSSFGGGMGWGLVTAPELMDPPLRAYTYMPMNPGEWKACDECAKVQLDPTQTYLVYGERPGSVSVLVAEFVEAPVIRGDFNQDGLVKDSEIVGVPAVPEGTMFLYLKGRHGVSTPFYVKVVSDADRPDYWTVKDESSPQSISGNINGPQSLTVKPLTM